MSLLKVENLSIKSYSGSPLVNNISFEVNRGETLVILGESGSGKTLTSLAILDLLPNSVTKTKGNIFIDNVEFSESMRGSEISMIMQSPATCFDQVYSIRTIFTDALKSHQKKLRLNLHSQKKQLQEHPESVLQSQDVFEISDEYLIKIIESVELPNALDILNSFAFQLSGGMLQRLMIALNLALNPQVIIADEATSDIDIVAQNDILKLLSNMNKKNKALLFITHDVNVAKKMADRIIVMKNGEIIDDFPIKDLYTESRHEYTKKLLLAHTNLNTNFWGIDFTRS